MPRQESRVRRSFAVAGGLTAAGLAGLLLTAPGASAAVCGTTTTTTTTSSGSSGPATTTAAVASGSGAGHLAMTGSPIALIVAFGMLLVVGGTWLVVTAGLVGRRRHLPPGTYAVGIGAIVMAALLGGTSASAAVVTPAAACAPAGTTTTPAPAGGGGSASVASPTPTLPDVALPVLLLVTGTATIGGTYLMRRKASQDARSRSAF